MGQSSNGLLFFGIAFEEDFQFPWDAEEYGGDTRAWYRDVNKGEWVEWDEANPLPIEMKNVCSGECPIWAMAVRGSVKTAHRGYPVRLPEPFINYDPKIITDFCAKYGIKLSEGKRGIPCWMLASYLG